MTGEYDGIDDGPNPLGFWDWFWIIIGIICGVILALLCIYG